MIIASAEIAGFVGLGLAVLVNTALVARVMGRREGTLAALVEMNKKREKECEDWRKTCQEHQVEAQNGLRGDVRDLSESMGSLRDKLSENSERLSVLAERLDGAVTFWKRKGGGHD